MRKSILCLLLFLDVFSLPRAQERAYPVSFTVRLTNDVGEPIADYPARISTFSQMEACAQCCWNGLLQLRHEANRCRWGSVF